MTNVYDMEVTYPDGECKVAQFDPAGNLHSEGVSLPIEERPRLVTISPPIWITIDNYRGKSIRISAWPRRSAGASGYRERRETNLYL